MKPTRSPRLALPLLAAIASCPALCHAQAQAPAASQTAKWSPAPLFPASSIQLKTLPSGVRVLTRATQGTGLVCVQVWVRAGSRYETLPESGAAHIIEQASLLASKGYSRAPGALEGGVARAIEALGGQVSAQTSRDATFLSVTVAAQYLPQALRALADATLRPDLSDAAIEEARTLALLGQQQREGNPLLAVSDLAYRAAFSKHPYSKPAGGTSLNIETMPAARVRAFHKKMYVGRSISVVVVGDLDAPSAHKIAATEFASAPTAAPPSQATVKESAPGAFQSVARKRPIGRSALAIAFSSPAVSKPEDVVAMDVLLALWREGSRATLRRALLSPRGLAPDAPLPDDDDEPSGDPPLALAYDVDYLTQRDASLFIVTMALEPGDKAEATEAVLAEVARVQEKGVSEAELSRAKNLLTEQYIAQGEGVSGQASSLGFYEMIDSYEFALKYLPRIQRVTGADIQRVAKAYFSRTKYLQASIEPLPPERVPEREPERSPLNNAPTITAQLSPALAQPRPRTD